MNRTMKIATTALSAVAIIASAAGSVSAHECFNESRSDQANSVIAQHSHGWFDEHVSQLVAIFVLSCAQQPSGGCPPPPPTLTPADLDALHNGNFEQLIGEILGFVPAEPAVAHLLAFTQQVENEAACMGVPTHFLTLAHATGAGGAGKNGKDSVTDGKGIDHFPDVYGAQLFQAYGIVLSGAPSSCN